MTPRPSAPPEWRALADEPPTPTAVVAVCIAGAVRPSVDVWTPGGWQSGHRWTHWATLAPVPPIAKGDPR